MANESCVYIPRVPDDNVKDGVTPVLWKSIYYCCKGMRRKPNKTLFETVREAANDIYRGLTDKSIIGKLKTMKGVSFDFQDNISLSYALNATDMKKELPKGFDAEKALAYAYGFNSMDEHELEDISDISDEPVIAEYDTERGDTLLKRVAQFNEAESDYTAKVHGYRGNRFYVTVEKNVKGKNGTESKSAEKFSYRLRNELKKRLYTLYSTPKNVEEAITLGANISGTDEADMLGFADSIIGLVRLLKGENGIGVNATMASVFRNVFRPNGKDFIAVFSELGRRIVDSGHAGKILGDEYDAVSEFYEGEDNEGFMSTVAAYAVLKHMKGENLGDGISEGMAERCANVVRNGNYLRNISEEEIVKSVSNSDKGIGYADGMVGRYEHLNSAYEKSGNVSEDTVAAKEAAKSNRQIISELLEAQVRMTNLIRERLKSTGRKVPNKVWNERNAAEFRLKKAYQSGDHIDEMQAVQSYVDNFTRQLEYCERTMRRITDDATTMPINVRAAKLQMIRDLIEEATITVEMLFIEDNRFTKTGNGMFDANLKMQLKDIMERTKKLSGSYGPLAKEYFLELAGEFVDRNHAFVIPSGPLHGKVMTLQEILDNPQVDISAVDMWLDSMSDSKNITLNVLDRIVKSRRTKANNDTIEDNKFILQHAIRLERETGSRDTSFMFARNSDGSIDVGTYICDYDQEAFDNAKKRQIIALEREYGDAHHRDDNADRAFRDELQDWENQQMTRKIGEYTLKIPRPDPEKYPSVTFNSLNDAQKDFYYSMMYMKDKKDSLLPFGTTYLTRSVKIRKDALQRMKSSGSLSEAYSELKKATADSFLVRSDDTEFGIRTGMRDFSGKEVKHPPIFYMNMKDDDSPSDMSLDVVSAMCMYTDMANRYNRMNEIHMTLEAIRNVIAEGQIAVRDSTLGKDRFEQMNTYITQVKKIVNKDPVSTNLIKKFDTYLDMQVYGRMVKDTRVKVGKKEVSAAKTSNVFNRITALYSTAFSPMSWISNLLTGNFNFSIEALSGEFFNLHDARKAQRQFNNNVIEAVGEMGNPVKNSKLMLFNEQYGITQEFERSVKEIDFREKSRFYRIMKMTPFGGNKLGEFFLHMMTALSVANSKNDRLYFEKPDADTVRDDDLMYWHDRKYISVFDAYDVVPLNPEHPEEGSRLVMKRGLYTKDGRRIITKEELYERAQKVRNEGEEISLHDVALADDEVSEYVFIDYFRIKTTKINQLLHGVYNEEDKNMLQQTAIGNMAIMYRKWMRPNIERRFGRSRYDISLEEFITGQPNQNGSEYHEGYYRTAGNLFKNVVKNLHETRSFMLSEEWKKLNEHEKANVKRCGAESAIFILVCLFARMLEALKDPDDGDDDDVTDSKLFAYLEYYIYRLKAEIGSLAPISIFPGSNSSMIKEMKAVLNEPVTGMQTWERILRITDVLIPSNWVKEMQSGHFKGHSMAYKAIMESIPFYRTIYGNLNPEERVRYYKNLR